jgi:hypothetical protein
METAGGERHGLLRNGAAVRGMAGVVSRAKAGQRHGMAR